MRKGLLAASFFFFWVTYLVYPQTPLGLDTAIKTAAMEINAKMETGNIVVVLNIKSPAKQASDYVLDELINALVSEGKLIVVDRQNLVLIQQEMDFQMSGEVSDTSAQDIGKKLGAKSIISGSLDDSGSNLRLRIRAIDVTTAAIQISSSLNVKKDSQTAALLAGSSAASSSTGELFPNGLNYSTGRKVGAGFLNWIYGLGSFTMGDWLGGFLVGGTMIGGMILMVATVPNVDEAGNTVGDTSPGFYAGMGIMFGGIIYGHIRPFTYDIHLAKKRGTYYKAYNPMDQMKIAIIPDNHGIRAMQMIYSFQF